MLISEKKIKIMIREEVVKVIKEKNNLLPIYENKKQFIKAYPQATDSSFDRQVQSDVKSATKKVKANIVRQYLSSQRKESFIRFIKSMSRFKNEKRENILEKFNYLRPLVLQVIKQIPVQSINDGVHSQKIYNNFLRSGPSRAVGMYDYEAEGVGKIIINPYHKSLMDFNGLNLPKLETVIKEEIYHAIDLNLSMKDKIGLIPMGDLQTGIAARKGIFLTPEESKADFRTYQYLTNPQEFYAKMLLLKDLVAEKYPEKIDQTGKIDNSFLKYLIKSAQTGQTRIFDDDGTSLEVLLVVDPTRIQQIQSFFDLLSKRVGKPSRRKA